jgi:hypothetical protein
MGVMDRDSKHHQPLRVAVACFSTIKVFLNNLEEIDIAVAGDMFIMVFIIRLLFNWLDWDVASSSSLEAGHRTAP